MSIQTSNDLLTISMLEQSRLPKYVQLAARLREQIMRGELRSSDRVPSFPQLRSEFGISQNTVEKAHALLEQEGLIVRRQGHGTFVTNPAKQPATGVIGCYGFHSNIRHLSYYTHLLRGIQSAAHRRGQEILLLKPDSPSVRWEKIDGVLSCLAEPEQVMRHLPPGMRCVSLLYETRNMSSVAADDYQGMRETTEYLLSLGHRRIAYLLEHDPMTGARRRGYEDALREAGIEAENRWLRPIIPHHPEEFRGRGRETMRQWIQADWSEVGCTALLAQNDRTAIGVMEALSEAGVRVPDDLSVVGFDSTDECELVTPRLTSIAVPLEEIGAKALELLESEMDAPSNAPQAVVLPTRLQIRDSTAAPINQTSGIAGNLRKTRVERR